MVLLIVLYTSLSFLRGFTDKFGLLQIPYILFHASILSLEAGFCFISYEETKAIENLNSLVERFPQGLRRGEINRRDISVRC